MLFATVPLESVLDCAGGNRADRGSEVLDGSLFEAGTACASRLVERVDAGVPLIGWTSGPFPVSRVTP